MNKIGVLCGLMLLCFLGHPVAQNSAAENLTAPSQSGKSTDNIKSSLLAVKGFVYNASDKKPMPGARIQAYGQERYAAMTDASGAFTIKLPQQTAVILVSAPECNPQLVALKGRTEGIRVYMLSEVFAPDYDQPVKVTNAALAGRLERTNALSIDEELGMRLQSDVRTIKRSGTPAIGSEMFIGGYHSLNISAQPLFVLDGVLLESESGKTPIHDGFFNNMLSAIDVDDIERVTVLKNGTSLYGAKGGNGVVLIETKRATSMATRIDVNVSQAVDTRDELPPMMDAENFRLYASDLLGRYTEGQNSFSFLNDDPDKFYYNRYHNDTRWSDYTYRNALTQKYSVSVRGGDQVAMYNLSLGFANSQSTLVGNDFQRLNLRFNTDVSLLKNLDIRFDVAYSNTRRRLFDDGAPSSYASGPILSTGFLSLIKAPILSPYEFDIFGNTTNVLDGADDYGLSLGTNVSYANPISILKYGTAVNKNYQQYDLITMSFTPKYRLSKSLELSSQVALSFNDETEKYFSPMTGVPSFMLEGKGMIYNHAMSQYIRKSNLFIDTRLNWKKQLGGHSTTAMGGARFINNTYKSNTLSGYNTGSDKMPDISGSLLYRDVDGNDDTWRSLSYYANFDYDYRGKYFLQGTVSMDGSSRFGLDGEAGIPFAGVRWGVFPSIQGAWMVSAEEFMRPLSLVNQLKLSAGYDVSGNDGIDNYASRAYFEALTFLGNATGIQLANIGNSSITWETTARMHVGVDMNLLENRINLTANLFKSNTDHLITLKQLNEVAGLGTYWSNEGALENKGFDVALNAKVVNTTAFKWTLGMSVGKYKNTITSLPDNQSFTTSLYGGEVLTQKGSPAGLFYGYETNGVFSTSSQAADASLYQLSATGAKEYFGAGDMIFIDQNHDGEINEDDKKVIGDPNPDFYGNIQTSLHYKKWALSALLKYSLGNDVYNYQRSQLESGSMAFNQSTALQNRWTMEGQRTNIPRASYGDPMGNSRFSDRWIEDGSYLKLKNVTLSYTLPVSSQWLQGISAYATVENLLTLTNYLGSDPETSLGSSVLCQGIDRGLLSSGRSFVLGLKISL